MRRTTSLCLVAAVCLLKLDEVSAAPPTAITGNGLGTTVTPTGTVYNITGGTTAGTNLFHSFSTFNVGTGDTANFNVTSNISNIVARVTGGSTSFIDGTITSTIGGGATLSSANLFLVNPAGVMFTGNAQVNLGGSFVASTANYVTLTDNSVFYGDVNHATADAGLTTAPISSFGFLAGATPGAIGISGGASFATTGVQFIGGDFTAGAGVNLTLAAPSATIGIFSGSAPVTTDGAVPFLTGSVSNYSTASNFAHGNVTLGTAATGATLAATGTGSGIVIRGGHLVQQGAGASTSAKGNVAIQADSLALSGTLATQSGTIGIDTTGDVTLTGGTIKSQGGAITLGASNLVNLTLDSMSAIMETATASGPLVITATGKIDNAGTISTAAASSDVHVAAHDLALSGTISTQASAVTVDTTTDATLTGGTISSNGGTITIGGTSLVNLTLDSTSLIDAVDAGVSVTSRGDLTLNGGSIESTNSSTGNAGNVSVTDAIGNITLNSGAQIASIGTGTGNAGNVTVNNGGALNSGKLLSIVGTGVANPNTGIFSMTTGTGNAGSVTVNALGSVTLSAGGQIASVATNTSGGTAGAVAVNLNANPSTLTIGGLSDTSTTPTPIIYSATANANKTDGNVTIGSLLTDIVMHQGAVIQTSAQDTQAGNVTVEGSSLTMDQYSAIQSVMSQTDSSDGATTGRTGSVFVLILNPRFFPFPGPISIADNAFIQTVANPNQKGFNPLGQVTVLAASLTEGGVAVTTTSDNFDFNYKIKGHTEIRMLNSTTHGAANGTDVSSSVSPIVGTLLGFPSSPSGTTVAPPPPGNGIVIDGSLGGMAGPVAYIYQAPTYVYTISPSDGLLAGNNLFLSFSEFNLGTNHPDSADPSKTGHVSEKVLFDAPGVANIIARVTGSAMSSIDGILAEAVGTTANLFFLNPSGMIFTSNAGLDLHGALTLSTADYLRVGSTGLFFSQAAPFYDSLITSTPSVYSGAVTAFGFLSNAPAPITFDTATLSNESSANSQIQVIGGDLLFENSALLNATQTLLFSAGSSGQMTFLSPAGSLATPTSFTSSANIFDDSTFATLGSISLTSESVLTVPTPNIASTILIRADSFTLTDSLVVDQTTAEVGSRGGQVLIDVRGAATIQSLTDSSFITTSALGATSGGSVQINAASLSISGQGNRNFTTGILSTAQPDSYYTSDSGYVPFTYDTPSTATGNAGSITLDIGGALTVSNFAQVSTNTNGLGSAGTIAIAGLNGVNPQVTVSGGGAITSSTSLDNAAFTSTGRAGRVFITASSLAVTGNPSLIATSAGTALNPLGPTGDGGSITISVTGQTGAGNGDITISNGGQISASSYNNGRGGEVDLTQSTSQNGITIDGMGSTSATGIFAAEFGSGDSAGLTLSTPAIGITTDSTLDLKAGGEITTSAGGNGSAGPIRIQSKSVTIDGTGADVSQVTGVLSASTGNGSSVFNANALGKGGDITLQVVGDIDLLAGGAISASSNTVGQAGTVTITQSGSTGIIDPAANPTTNGGLYISGGTISTAANGIGTALQSATAGDITLNTQALTLNGGSIISSTFGLSKAGDILIDGATGGRAQFVAMQGGAKISSNTGGAGAGGKITMKSGALTVTGSGSAISTSALAGTGGGGSITLTLTGNQNILGSTGDLVVTNGGTISASSQTVGEAGTVTITQSGSIDITDPTLNPATNGGIYLNNGTITTAANGAGTITPSNANAGNITLNTQALTATNGALILSSTLGLSKGGDVTVNGLTSNQSAQFVVLLGGAKIASETGGAGGVGAGGTVSMLAGSVMVDGATISTSSTGGLGKAGDISITASSIDPAKTPFVTVQNSGAIKSESSNIGAAGMISIAASQITVDGAGSVISTDAGTIGNAANSRGEITLAGNKLTISNSGLISATTGGFSPGGTITVSASDFVALTSQARIDASSTANAGGGNGGSVFIGSAPTVTSAPYGSNSPQILSMTDGASISADSQNTNGGNIAIHTGQLVLNHGSVISTNEPHGDTLSIGGNITIKADQLFDLDNYSFVNSNAGQGTGGNIIIDPQFVILNHSGISAAGGFANGNVTIDSTYVLSSLSFIVATGTVSIDSVPLDLGASLVGLPADLTSEQSRLREKCARAIKHEFSSFIEVGRNGTESAPNELQPDFGVDALPDRAN